MSEEEEHDVLFWGGVWVTMSDALKLQQDAEIYGNCYVKITQRPEYDEPVGERVPPMALHEVSR